MQLPDEIYPSSARSSELRWRFTPSPVEWFCLGAGLILVFCYAWLMDDAYVYFRYVDNFVVHGQGLVWNPGEYVEGFSSPLWAVILSVLRALHLNYWTIIRGLGLLSFAAFWWIACVVNRGLYRAEEGTERSLNLPLLYLTFTYAFSCYFTSGLEAPLVSVAAVGYAAAILWPHSRIVQILVGLSPLVRQELLLPLLMFLGYAVVLKKVRPYLALVVFALTSGGYGLFRVWYYADIFPNTFYLKDLVWISQGIKYVYDTVLPYQTVPYLLLMVGAFVLLVRDKMAQTFAIERLVMWALALPIVAYVIKIGGDPRHFRYLAFPFVLMVASTGGIVELFLRRFTKYAGGSLALPVGVISLALLSNFPRQLDKHPLFRVPMKDVNHQVYLIGDAAAHRLRKNQLTPTWGGSSAYLSYSAAVERYHTELFEKRILQTQPLGEVIPPGIVRKGTTIGDLPMISDSWCQNGFLHAALPVVHNLGLTEPFLARTRMHSDRPAHKYGLRPLAMDILKVRSKFGFVPGAFDQALAGGRHDGDWIAKNIESLRAIEKKVYNQHNFTENLSLALTHVETILP